MSPCYVSRNFRILLSDGRSECFHLTFLSFLHRLNPFMWWSKINRASAFASVTFNPGYNLFA